MPVHYKLHSKMRSPCIQLYHLVCFSLRCSRTLALIKLLPGDKKRWHDVCMLKAGLQAAYPFFCPLDVCSFDSKSIVISIVQLLDKLTVVEEWILFEGEGDLVARFDIREIFDIHLRATKNGTVRQTSDSESYCEARFMPYLFQE